MNPLHWFEGLPTWGKAAVGGGAGLIILLIWQPWKKSSSTSTANLATSPNIASGTPLSGGGGGGSVAGNSSGTPTYGSTGTGSSIGSNSSGSGGTTSTVDTGSGVGLPVDLPGSTISIGSVTTPPNNSSTPTQPIGGLPGGGQVGVTTTSVNITQPKSHPQNQSGSTSIAANQTASDKAAQKPNGSTVTDIGKKGTGGVTSKVVSTIGNANKTNIVNHPTNTASSGQTSNAGGYTVAQGGASYNAATDGAGGQWLVGSDGKSHFYKGAYNNQGDFVTTGNKNQPAPASKPGGNIVQNPGNGVYVISPKSTTRHRQTHNTPTPAPTKTQVSNENKNSASYQKQQRAVANGNESISQYNHSAQVNGWSTIP